MILYVMESENGVSSHHVTPWGRASHPVPSYRKTIPSYREELTDREPRAVDARCPGGAFGCPGDYFRGASAADCRPIARERCEACWGADYEDEEWIEYDERVF